MGSFHLIPNVGIDLVNAPAEAQTVLASELFSGGDHVTQVVVEWTDVDLSQDLDETLGSTASLSNLDFRVADRSGRLCTLDFQAADSDGITKILVGRGGFSTLTLVNNLLVPLSLIFGATAGVAPLHASGFRSKGSDAVVMSAWSGVGKTQSVLKARQVGLDDYMGDDMVLINGSGQALTSPRRISAFTYNNENLDPSERRRGLQPAVGSLINRVLSKSSKGRSNMLGRIIVSRLGHTPVSARTTDNADWIKIDRHVILRASDSALNLGTPEFERLANMHWALSKHEYSSVGSIAAASQWAGHAFGMAWQETVDAWLQTYKDYFRTVNPISTETPRK